MTAAAPPTGTVTFLFTDIEGSTKFWEQNPEAMCPALARHDVLLRDAIETSGGYVFKTVGDAFCAAFPTAPEALQAAYAAQLALADETWETETPLRVRMALHTGAADERGGDYFGPPLNRVARVMAGGHGGQILLSDVSQGLVRDALPLDASLLGLGEHRFKDLGRPEQVFQLLHHSLPADFPLLRSLDNPALPNNLPQQATSFIGREKEVAQIKALLTQTRLLTLTGTGGSGKTRLSLQVAADLLDGEGDGVWLVELAPLADPDMVPQAVAQALGIREQAGQPILHTLVEWLKPKRLLLILDNCEHLVTACAALASELLRACSGVHLLASSREPLNVAGEQTYRVPSLSLPDPKRPQTAESLSQYEAVALFLQRAKAAQPTFTVMDANASVVAQVCQRLDGIPLAIELAAARVRAMPIEQVNARLGDRFRLLTGGSRTALPRQQTLRALMDWSYDLLTGQEKILLGWLSVFTGGWTLEAAESVCLGQGIEDWEVLDLLTSLVDKSLVVYDDGDDNRGRYRLLETIRQYAGERLTESGAAQAARDRHLAWCLALAEKAEHALHGPEQTTQLDCLEAERDNLRAALESSQASDRPEARAAGLRMTGALFWFWHLHGHYSEGRGWLEAALTYADEEGGGAAQARAFQGAGQLAYYQSDYTAARSFLEQSGTIWRASGDLQGLAYSQVYLCAAIHALGDYESAAAVITDSVALARACGNRWTLAMSLWMHGTFLHTRGDNTTARPLLEESAALFREVGDRWALIAPLIYLVQIACDAEDHPTALPFLVEALRLSQDIGDKMRLSGTLDLFAHLALSKATVSEAPGRAARLFGAATALRRAMMASMPNVVKQRHERGVAAAREALGEEAFAVAWAEGEAMTLDEVVEYALAVE